MALSRGHRPEDFLDPVGYGIALHRFERAMHSTRLTWDALSMSLRSMDLGRSAQEIGWTGLDGVMSPEAVAEITRQMRVTIEEWEWEMESMQFWRRHARSPLAPTSRNIAFWFSLFLCNLSISLWLFFTNPHLWAMTFGGVLTPLFYSFICWVRYVQIDYW